MLQEKPSSALKRGLKKAELIILWVIFALLDPDPDPDDQNQCGSGSTLLLSQPNLKALQICKQFLNPSENIEHSEQQHWQTLYHTTSFLRTHLFHIFFFSTSRNLGRKSSQS
jgi:hypothetical protein